MWFRSTSIIWKSVRNADLQTHIAVCRSTTKGMNPRDLMVSKRKYVEQEYTADFGLLNYKVDFHCQSLIYWLLIFLFLATSCSTWDPSFPTRDLSDPSSLQWKLGVLTTGQLGKSYWFLNFMTEFKKMKVVKWPFSHTIKFFTQQRIMIINFFIRFSSQVLKREKKNASGKESTCQCRRCRFDSQVRKIPWRRKWQPTPVFLPGKSHGQRSLVGFTPWGHKRVGHDLATEQQISLVSYIIFIELFHLSVLLHKKGMIRKSSPRIATTPEVIVKIKWINIYEVFRMGPGTH